jgi:uncharacterized membrane protein
VPVLARFDDFCQLAFETGRTPGGTVYLPGAPNPWSGCLVFVDAERVRKLPASATEALKVIRALGRGSEALAAELSAVQHGALAGGPR